jgi:hypothetical protein
MYPPGQGPKLGEGETDFVNPLAKLAKASYTSTH